MHTHKITSVLLSSVLILSIVGLTTTTNALFAQTFDIQTSQEGKGEAVITVQLATNNTVVIPPNGTIIEVPGNITQVDNDTVIITPDNETVTEIPDSNVTVITPPVPEPCGCPPAGGEGAANETAAAPEIPPVLIRPAPGQNITEVPPTDNVTIPEPVPVPPPEAAAGNETTDEMPPAPDISGDNETAIGEPQPVSPADNETIVIPSPGENVTVTEPPASSSEGENGLSPANAITPSNDIEKPWWMA